MRDEYRLGDINKQRVMVPFTFDLAVYAPLAKNPDGVVSSGISCL